MAFWTSPSTHPVKKFQFRLLVGELMWHARSVSLPKFDLETSSYTLINQKFKYPGMVTWQELNISLVEMGSSAKMVMNMLAAAGYGCPGEKCDTGITKEMFHNGTPMIIELLNPHGEALQHWEIQNWFISSADFGELSYENDELLNVDFQVGFDCAVLKMGGYVSKPTNTTPAVKDQEKKEKKEKVENKKAELKVNRGDNALKVKVKTFKAQSQTGNPNAQTTLDTANPAYYKWDAEQIDAGTITEDQGRAASGLPKAEYLALLKKARENQ